jgi:chromosome segregation ATPase
LERFKQTAEELRNKLNEAQRVKDEGWRELNARVQEIENLRQVINEQERLLEERRVGLMSLEQSLQGQRGGKDDLMRETMEIKRERDELREKVIKLKDQVENLEEDNRRVSRQMSEQGGYDQQRTATEIRELKAELKKSESDRATGQRRINELEGDLNRLRSDLENRVSGAAAAGGAQMSHLKKKAEEAYYGINDALSELRTNILLAKDLVQEHGHKVRDTSAVNTLNEAIQVSADRAEDAKGLLKNLLEVIER